MNDSTHIDLRDERLDSRKLGTLPQIFLIMGVVGLALSAILGYFNPERFAFSWLFAFTYFFTICCGSLFWVLLHHALDADWSVIVRRVLEQVASLFPILVILFIPLIFLGPKVYTWMTVEHGHDPLLDEKAAYLNKPFFYIRMVIYFTFFIVASLLMKRFSTEQDITGNPDLTLRMRKVSYGFIPAFALSLTFAAFDWLMGLDYHWFSTMFGVYIFAGSALSSMALLILITNGLKRMGYLQGMTVEHNHIMGKLLFVFVVFWAYISFSQYFLIWYGNIPEETWFFIHRNEGSWNYVARFIVIGHFAIPFLWLITQPAKRNPKRLCAGAIWMLFMHAVDLYWLILPQLQVNQSARASGGHGAAHATGLSLHLLDFATIAAFTGVLGFVLLRFLPKHSLFPIRDARLLDSVYLKN